MSDDMVVQDLGALLDAERENRKRLEAELAEWQRHGVKVTEDCGCTFAYMLDDDTVTGEIPPAPDCPDCGCTGKKLRDGVWICRTEANDNCPRHEHGAALAYAFPAEWLEAE